MEPNRPSYNAELPEPIGDGNAEAPGVQSPEASTGLQPPVLQNTQAINPLPQPVLPSTASTTQAVAPPAVDSPLIADDADLIEKEWVLKAKAIVAQTAHDPNLQTKEMGKVKAEYLRKRYNKNLKLDEN